MRSVEQARARVGAWVRAHLVAVVAGGEPDSGTRVVLQAPTGAALARDWPAVRQWALTWREAEEEGALPEGVTVTWSGRRVGSVTAQLPERVVVAGLDAAAAWAGARGDLARARTWWERLRGQFPATATPAVLRAVLRLDEVDAEVAVATATWLAARAGGDVDVTPRQVPVPGVHAKWLDGRGHRDLVAALAGRARLTVLSRPVRTHVTYLDPGHAAAGGRRWDVWTEGDAVAAPYPVRWLLVVENRDTAIYFPPQLPGAVAVCGDGDAAASKVAHLPGLARGAPLLYWGDMDLAGLAIVARLRRAGHEVATVLMDVGTYRTYQRFGTSTDTRHQPLPPAAAGGPPEGLTAAEADLWRVLADPGPVGPRRVEQERIPFAEALPVITAAAATLVGDPPRR